MLGTGGPRDLQSGGVHSRADVAQLAEHITRNDGVRGSIPRVGSKTTCITRVRLLPTLANDAALPTPSRHSSERRWPFGSSSLLIPDPSPHALDPEWIDEEEDGKSQVDNHRDHRQERADHGGDRLEDDGGAASPREALELLLDYVVDRQLVGLVDVAG